LVERQRGTRQEREQEEGTQMQDGAPQHSSDYLFAEVIIARLLKTQSTGSVLLAAESVPWRDRSRGRLQEQ
jgi:hypothetical protein